MGRIYDDITQTIGDTPVVELRRLSPEGRRVFVKLEARNPGGSVKDRLALGVIEDAEKKGLLKPGDTVVEATSGNTGIGLAVVCAQRGYPLVVTMAENFSIERRKLMRFLGARVVLTPAAEKGTGMLKKAVELAAAHGWFLARQFENEANAEVHARTTAREILDDFSGERLDAWVTGFGTGGTLKGVARVLKAERPECRIVVAEPDNAPLFGSGAPQPRDADGAVTESHPAFRPHVMQGWSPDFIAKLAEDARDAGHVDEIVPVAGGDAMQTATLLARQEGIFAGVSGGATLAAALAHARTLPAGACVLAMLPDTGERYLSTPLFFDIDEDMNADERAISESTPSARFGAPPPADIAAEPAPVAAADAEAVAFVDRTIADNAAVMFALEWCEFCWAVRKLFKALGVDYVSVDLDAAAMQEDGWGARVRAALTAKLKVASGLCTIPQVFVASEHLGGATETLEACASGELAAQLDEAGVAHAPTDAVDPWSFLPGWVAKAG